MLVCALEPKDVLIVGSLPSDALNEYMLAFSSPYLLLHKFWIHSVRCYFLISINGFFFVRVIIYTDATLYAAGLLLSVITHGVYFQSRIPLLSYLLPSHDDFWHLENCKQHQVEDPEQQ